MAPKKPKPRFGLAAAKAPEFAVGVYVQYTGPMDPVTQAWPHVTQPPEGTIIGVPAATWPKLWMVKWEPPLAMELLCFEDYMKII